MLVCVGGIPGSGRKDFARRLAERLGFYALDLEGSMRTMLLLNEYRRARTPGEDTISDDLRLRMFEHVARSFEHLSHTFRNVVVDEPLHRERPREALFASGARHFGAVALVWVATDADIHERIRRIMAKNPRLTAQTAGAIIERMERDFEPFTAPLILARNVIEDTDELDRIVRELRVHA